MIERKSLDERIEALMNNGSRGHRLEICKRDFIYFAVYYFPQYFSHQIPPFHYDMYNDCNKLAKGELSEVAWIIFREGAKTSIAKMFLIYMICHKLKNYINVDSYDDANCESILFDVTVALQTNAKLIADYGHLYHKKPEKNALIEAKMKRIKNFITENGVKVEAFSTQQSTRGRIYKEFRPDFFLIDDFENNQTKDSYPKIHRIKEHINELRSGLPVNAGVLYLGNYITEGGAVEFVMDAMRRDPERCRLRLVNAEDRSGNPSWPGKYTRTNAQAAEINATIDIPRRRRISLESRKQSLGVAVYQSEMMNNPAHGGDKVFDRAIIDELIKNSRDPLREVAGLKIWYEFNPSHRYAIGADTAKGVGKDSNASAIVDFSTIPNRVVATYRNSLMSPDIFGYELKRQGDMYGLPLLAPENANTGYATLTVLKKIYPTNRIYVPIREEKLKEKLSDDYGWETNSATKPEMIYQLKRAVEDGLLAIYDVDLLNELKFYGQKDLVTMKLVDGMTRHYDVLIAVAIAWMMRTHAKLSSDQMRKRAPNQSKHVPIAGEYGG